MKKISIITVCLNAKDDLDKTLASIAPQKTEEVELVIIDGNSTDGSQVVFKEYSDIIDCLVVEEDKGIYDAQNKGISNANGRFLLFLNAGDILKKGVLAEVVLEASYPDLIYGHIDVKISEDFGFIKKMKSRIGKMFLNYDTIAHQAVFIKKSLFDKIGKYKLEYPIVADYEFFVRAIFKENCSSRQIDLVISEYKMDGTSSRLSNRRKMMKERAQIKKLYYSGFELFVFGLLSPFYYLFVKYPSYLKRLRRRKND
jgi:glycosyltransferase involved in cell wall biosynthesis